MSLTDEKKRKYIKRLNMIGYNLVPAYNSLQCNNKAFIKEIDEKYGERLLEYVKSVNTGGSAITNSFPPVVCGKRELLDKFLALFIIMCEDFQGKKFGIEDLKVIKSKKEEENEDEPFLDYMGLAIVDLHSNTISRESMEEWRMECILENITTRQRNRLPMVLVSEKPLGTYFTDELMFTYINVNLIDKENTPVTKTAGVTYECKEDPHSSATVI